jgi:hypothetical protein
MTRPAWLAPVLVEPRARACRHTNPVSQVARGKPRLFPPTTLPPSASPTRSSTRPGSRRVSFLSCAVLVLFTRSIEPIPPPPPVWSPERTVRSSVAVCTPVRQDRRLPSPNLDLPSSFPFKSRNHLARASHCVVPLLTITAGGWQSLMLQSPIRCSFFMQRSAPHFRST